MSCVTNERWRNALIFERIKKTGANREQVAADFASCELMVEARLWNEFLQARLWGEEGSTDVPASVLEDAEAVWVGARFGLPDGSLTWQRVAAVLDCPVERAGLRLVLRWREEVKREFARLLPAHRSCRTSR